MDNQSQKKAGSGETQPTSQSPRGISKTTPARAGGSEKLFSPLRFLIITIGGIFLAEVMAMILIFPFREMPYHLQAIFDATIMVLMVFPLVYSFSLRPLISHIEEQRRAEEALRQSEERFERAFRSNPAALSITLVADERFFDINESFLNLYGYTREEVIGRTVNELNLYATPEEYEELRQRLFQQGSVRHYEIKTRTKGGKDRVVSVSIEPIEFGGETYILAIASDITEQRLAEELNRQLSRIVEQTEDTVVVTDCDGIIEYVNPSFERQTGYTKEEALGKTPRVIKSGIHEHEFYRNLWNTILRGEVFQGEIANRRKNDEIFYEVKTIAPLRDAQGDITHFVATGKDITRHKLDEEKLRKAYDELELRVQDRTEELRIANSELEDEINVRRRTEAALLEANEKLQVQADEMQVQHDDLVAANEHLRLSEERFRAITEISPVAVGVTSTDGTPLYLNRAYEEYFGYTGEELMKLNAPDLYWDPEDQLTWLRAFQQKGFVRDLEIKVRRKDGTPFWALLSATPINYGGVHAIMSTIIDVTDRMQAEEALRAANEELTRFNSLMVGRELRMIELKKEVNALCKSAGQPTRYLQGKGMEET